MPEVVAIVDVWVDTPEMVAIVEVWVGTGDKVSVNNVAVNPVPEISEVKTENVVLEVVDDIPINTTQ